MKKPISLKYILLLVVALFLAGCPPFLVKIITPSDGKHFEVGKEISFKGLARDFKDGALSEDSLVWESSIDGQIGTGKEFTEDTLSEGTHIITLTATNSQGESNSSSITIAIGEVTPTTTTTTTTTAAADTTTSIGTTTTTATQTDTGIIILSSDSESDLLFYIVHEDGSAAYYYGFDASSGMELTHVISEDGTIVLFNEDFIPIQWISDGLTVVAYREDNEQPFNPHSAYHEFFYGDSEDSFIIDIYPDNLNQIVSGMEAYTGQQFHDASTFLTTYNISNFSELVTLAKQNGQEQARYMAAAAGFSTAAAFLSMEAQGALSKPFSSSMPSQAPYAVLVKFVVGLLASKFNDAFGPSGPTDPNTPVVEVALCRGVAQYGICHYLFFHMEDYGTCIEKCLTSMRCFTDICMPGYTVSAEVAQKSRDHYMGGGG